MATLTETLAERGELYGDFSGHAKLSQSIKGVIEGGRSYPKLNSSQREALEMIAHKIARIINGDPNYVDSWVDICGYSQLIVDQLKNG